MTDRFRVPLIMAQQLRAQGVKPAMVLQRAGLPSGFFEQPKIYVTTAELFALWRAVGESSNDPLIGLKIGGQQRVEHFNPTSIAAISSKSFRDAVQRIGRYKRLTCPEDIRMRAVKNEVAIDFVFTEAEEVVPEVLVDVCLSWILTLGRRGTDSQLAPLRVELMRPKQDADILERAFGCRVTFTARRNALIFSSQDMDRPFVTHNADLLAMIGTQLDAELLETGDQLDLNAQVKRAVKLAMAGTRPTLQAIAREIGVSDRTLQRRLTEAGSSFQQLAEDARREMARHYLKQSSIEYDEVAYLLGYEEVTSFFRAFHQWEGTSPGDWRAQHGVREQQTT